MARAVVVKKAGSKAAGKPVASPVAKAKSKARKPKRTAAQVVATTLPAAMTGRASPAKAAEGNEPVFAYIRSLPQPQRGIAERVDALAAKTLPALQRAVKWGMAWYGVGDGWCFSCGGFAGHVKLTFGRGTALEPVPPVAPIGMGKDSRGVDLESVDDLDEGQAASWMKQATAIPGFGKTKPSAKKVAEKTSAKTAIAKKAPPRSDAAPKKPRVFAMSFASVYPLYVQKAEKKGRTAKEVDEIITWLTGYSGEQLQRAIDTRIDLEAFFAQAPRMNPHVGLITGVVCGVRVEDVADPLMQKIRYLDKLIDELAKGKKMASILRQ